ncbi:putative Quinone oxidoreductase [Balamuthia mandrillaris]
MSYSSSAPRFALAHRNHVRHLYRRSLVLSLNWKVGREAWYESAALIRDAFRKHMHETDVHRVAALVKRTEECLEQYSHPNPYTLPHAFGGSKFQRNLPVPKEVLEGWTPFEVVEDNSPAVH